ncbi:acyltransferase [Desulfococcaceae bacterium HSG8]|nr:acyltransferase [Desulfococcaceae bacterium HSG8]
MKDQPAFILNTRQTEDSTCPGFQKRIRSLTADCMGIFRGCFLLILYALNTALWCPLLIFFGILKLIIPINVWRNFISKIITKLAFNWVAVNNFTMARLTPVCLDIEGLENLDTDDWYLVLSNHQTWVDILVLQRIFYKQIPFLKFFIKKELIWVPLLGITWWALDFPFMKRYSKSFLAKNPHLLGKDMEITRKACEKFKTMPVSVMNFVEGTRFTESKHLNQKSPYKNLLKPKAGGVAQVVSAMGEYINHVLSVTIVYPEGKNISFWSLLCGKIRKIRIDIKSVPVSNEMMGDYANDREFRKQFQKWLNDIWADKDRIIDELKQ